MSRFRGVQSRTPGQGQRRGGWPTTIEKERRHALDIEMEEKSNKQRKIKKEKQLKTEANLPTEGP